MEIIVRCNNCDKALEVLTTILAPGSYNVILEVEPCKSKDCGDCSECEDMKFLKIYREADKQLQSQLEEYHNAKVETKTNDGDVQSEFTTTKIQS